VTDDSNAPSWTGLAPMRPVPAPRVLTKEDVPRLADRVKLVLFGRWRDHSGWESAVHGATLVLLAGVVSFLWPSAPGTWWKLVAVVVAAVVIVGAGTAIRLRLRFRT
jgi:hypothetical protein